MANGEIRNNVDYYALIGLGRGCSRSELQRAHLLLCLKHKHDKATSFIDRCELADERDVEDVKERAKMSALLLYRLIQKGYASVMATITEEEAAEKQRKRSLHAAANASANANANANAVQVTTESEVMNNVDKGDDKCALLSSSPSVFQGVFCRDLAVVGNLLSQVGFNRSIPMKYEALSC